MRKSKRSADIPAYAVQTEPDNRKLPGRHAPVSLPAVLPDWVQAAVCRKSVYLKNVVDKINYMRYFRMVDFVNYIDLTA